MNYICVVQVRYRSQEFPGKSLARIGEQNALEYLLTRLKKSAFFSGVIVATTPDREDDEVVAIAERVGVEWHRGTPADVLTRIYDAAKPHSPWGVVKVLGNTPLIDMEEMELLVKEHFSGGYDYAYNEHSHGVIFGMGCSVFSFKTLESLAHSPDLTPEQREIGSLFIRQHPEKFRIHKRNTAKPRSLYRVSIDEPRDVELVRSIIKYVGDISHEAVGDFLDENQLLIDYQKGSGISETGLDKLFLFSDKLQGFLNGNSNATYPVSIELSLTNDCNFNCVWCSDGGLRDRLGGEFKPDELGSIFADLKAGGTRGVVIEGGGEPMIHKDFAEIVGLAKKAGLALGLITNGSVKLDEDLIPNFEWVRVSLDAATPEQHIKAKKVNVFEKVMKNIKHIGERKVNTTLGIGYVVTKENCENLENLVLRLRNYGVDYLQLRPVIDKPDLWPDADLSFLKKFESGRFKVDVSAMSANDVTGNGGKPCVTHNLSAVVTADGGVYLCGRLNIYDWVRPVGNLHKNTFREIWLGEERKRQAREVANPDFCLAHCPECRMTKYNLLVNRVRNLRTKNFI